MGFRCDFCKRSQPPRTKARRIVTEVRRVILPPVQKCDPKTHLIVVSSEERSQIAKEKLACPLCAAIDRVPKVIATIGELK